jgi:hypothetical protein
MLLSGSERFAGVTDIELIVKTVKLMPLVFTPLVFTTTFPVDAPLGTGTTIWLAPQLVGVAVTPLNLTVLVPCVVPKFAPEIVTDIPTAPNVGDKLAILGVGLTVKLFPLLAIPPTITTTLPVVAAVGTDALIEVALHELIVVALVPLNCTELPAWVVPNPVPVIVTEAPTAPEVGDKLVMLGAVTVNGLPALAIPPTVTMTLPVVAPVGTAALIDVALHEVIVVAVVPLNCTELVLWLVPKPVPVIVTEMPAPPVTGDKVVILGAVTVNGLPLLTTPPTVTTMLPVVAPVGTAALIDVALHRVIVVAVVPLNFTVLVPWVVPKPLPVIVTDVPAPPEVGDRLVMLGAAIARIGMKRNARNVTNAVARVSI